ncbi:MAG: twin-arginine translocase subunit TatC [Synergistaceae bacterium]|nr:twin-arginine translocase subunit TatC [Synergistaceae bacterium]
MRRANKGEEPGDWAEHLDELRRRIISVLAVFFLCAALAFAFSGRIASFLMTPVADLGTKLYVFSPTEKFMAYLHMSAITGIAVTTPFFVLQAGLFVWPALKGSERAYARFALLAVPSLFLAGSAIAYKFFAPVALEFFLSFGGGDGVEALWGFGEYLALLSGLMLAVGVMLQLPLFMLAMFALGVTSPERAASARPYVVLLIFFLAGVMTPPDVTSQIMLGVPLYLLFEATLFAGSVISKNRR